MMTTENSRFVVTILGLLSILLILFSLLTLIKSRAQQEDKISMLLYEKGYYDGQKAALEGDIRLVQVTDTLNITKWVWKIGPHNDSRKLNYIP